MDKLAVRLPNWVGDAIMALPALEALSNADLSLSLYGKPWIKSLFTAYPWPKYVMPSDFRSARRMCNQAESDYFLLLTNSLSSAASVFFSGKKAIGYQTDVRRLLLASCLPKQANQHEVEYFWQLAKHSATQVFSMPWQVGLPDNINLQLTPQVIKVATDVLHHHQIETEYIVLCPGAVGQGVESQSKVWPHWRELANELLQLNYQIVTCPGPGEEQLFKQLLPPNVIGIANLGLDTYAAVMSQAQCVVANDSGPMHLAAATNSRAIGLFGVTDPARTKPWGGQYLGSHATWSECSEVVGAITSAVSGN